MQLVALRGQSVDKGQVGLRGQQDKPNVGTPQVPDHGTYHAILLLEAPEGSTHRAAAWCKGQRG